ncbi:NHLP leader peptide domain protein [Thiorhodovibrio winogradskyi]|uniref:NHLP leader peptide domain protein n=2 Tax=Thiorhodovibrio winogradskyi TaxID=77007 RepID=A0ABZ0S7I5_9GAMM
MSANENSCSADIHKKVAETLDKILTKANEDEAFGALCVKDFGAAFAQLIGKPMPEGAGFSCEKKGGRVLLKVPANQDNQSDELTDSDLEKVAGGFTNPFTLLQKFLAPGEQFPVAPAYAAPSWFGNPNSW